MCNLALDIHIGLHAKFTRVALKGALIRETRSLTMPHSSNIRIPVFMQRHMHEAYLLHRQQKSADGAATNCQKRTRYLPNAAAG